MQTKNKMCNVHANTAGSAEGVSLCPVWAKLGGQSLKSHSAQATPCPLWPVIPHKTRNDGISNCAA